MSDDHQPEEEAHRMTDQDFTALLRASLPAEKGGLVLHRKRHLTLLKGGLYEGR